MDGHDHVVTASSLARGYAWATPLTIERGEGCELIADDGSRYLDCISGYGVNSTGHCHPRVVAAVQAQAERLLHSSIVGRRADLEAYAERLTRLAPMPDAKVFFTNSGTESVEAALKLVRYASERPIIVAFDGGFHGRTLGSLSVTSSKASDARRPRTDGRRCVHGSVSASRTRPDARGDR